MVEDYFVFKDKSSEEFNIVIEEDGMPSITNSQNEIESAPPIPGRDGVLTIDTGRRKEINKTIACVLLDEDRKQDVRAWLKGSGDLVLSNEDDVFYQAIIKESVELKDHWSGGWYFEVEFQCKPYGFLHNGRDSIEVTQKNTILYNHEEKSLPLIKIFGVGPVEFVANEKIYKADIDGYMEIDSELMESYKDILPVPMVGGFPCLVPGENNITWLGSVTKIEVIPRWRR